MTTQRASAMPAAVALTSLDEPSDWPFRPAPRIEPVEDPAIAAVTELYRRTFPPDGAILDLMASWVSHLPPEASYRRVVGVGIDARALEENAFLDEWLVQDLNGDPLLPFADGEFDGAALCVAVQHLSRPVEVLREVGRVLRPGAPLVIAFSNRCVASRPIACWQLLDEEGQVRLLGHCLGEAGNWRDGRCWHCCRDGADPLHAVIAYSTGAA
jgi:SAM-dependent methyltransferase